MNICLNRQQKDEFVKRGFSRRDLGRVAAMITAGAALPFWNEPAMAQLSAIRGAMPPDAVKINANENPLGPCEEALAAIHKVADVYKRQRLSDALPKTVIPLSKPLGSPAPHPPPVGPGPAMVSFDIVATVDEPPLIATMYVWFCASAVKGAAGAWIVVSSCPAPTIERLSVIATCST